MTASTGFVLALTAAVVAVISCRAVKSHESPARPETELLGNRPVTVKFTCPAIYGRYPHPLSCEYFFECRFSYPTLMHCNRGYLYDESREQCRDKRKVNCRRGDHKDNKNKIPEEKEEIKYFKCPYIWGTFAHPNDCSKYFVCLYNVPTLFQCQGSELFHDKARKCLHRNKVDCGNRPDRDGTKTSWEPLKSTPKTVITTPAIPLTTKDHKEFICPFEFGRFADPEDCSQYYDCHFFQAFLQKCPRSTLFDDSQGKCREERLVNCDDKPGTKASWKPLTPTTKTVITSTIPTTAEDHKEFICPFEFGRFADPEDCSQYYGCHFFQAFLQKCPKSTLFDDTQGKCREEGLVNCGDRPGTKASWKPLTPTTKTVITTTIPTTAEDHKKFICPFEFGRFADSEDCSQYYDCHFFQAFLQKCPRSTLFDDSQGKCREEGLVNCGDRPGTKASWKPLTPTTKTAITTTIPTTAEDHKKFICPFPFGRFADPEDCSQYYDCHFFEAFLRKCPRSTLFDDSQGKCREEGLVNCGDGSGTKASWKPLTLTPTTKTVITTTIIPTTTEDHRKFFCPFPSGRYADPEDCSQYYECHSSRASLQQCPKSTLYDERQEECREGRLVRCGNRPGGIGGDVEDKKETLYCPYTWGSFAHPTDCSKYIVCIYNFPTVFTCRKNELFHAYIRRCLPKYKVSCNNRINPDDLFPPVKSTSVTTFPTTAKKIPITTASITSEPTTTTTLKPTTTTPEPSTTTTPEPTTTTTSERTTTTTPEPTTTTTPKPTTTTPEPTTTTTPEPTTTTTPEPTTTTTPEPTTTTTPKPTTTASPEPTTTSSPEPTTMTTTSSKPTTTTPTKSATITQLPVTKPNTPPPTDCNEDDLDCIVDETGDVTGWFDCPERYGHFPHGSSKQLFIHCDNFRPFVKKCADQTEFSPEYLVCTWVDKTKGV